MDGNESQEEAHKWIRVPVGAAQTTAAEKKIGISDWSARRIDAKDSGLSGEVELGPQCVVTVDQVHDAACGRGVVPFVEAIVRAIQKQVLMLDIELGVVLSVQLEDGFRLPFRQVTPVLERGVMD